PQRPHRRGRARGPRPLPCRRAPRRRGRRTRRGRGVTPATRRARRAGWLRSLLSPALYHMDDRGVRVLIDPHPSPLSMDEPDGKEDSAPAAAHDTVRAPDSAPRATPWARVVAAVKYGLSVLWGLVTVIWIPAAGTYALWSISKALARQVNLPAWA